jgi:hypothetical protein
MISSGGLLDGITSLLGCLRGAGGGSRCTGCNGSGRAEGGLNGVFRFSTNRIFSVQEYRANWDEFYENSPAFVLLSAAATSALVQK